MNIILNEREYISSCINEKKLGKKPGSTIAIAESMYRADGCEDVRGALENFISICEPGKPVEKWNVFLDNLLASKKKRSFVEIESIPITQKELDTIRSVPGLKRQRLAFTLLVSAKYCNLIYNNTSFWSTTKDADIFRMANVKVSVNDQCAMFKYLYDNHFIEYAEAIDSLNVRVNYADPDGEPVWKVTDCRNLGYQYMNRLNGGYMQCRECGIWIKRVTNNQLYCGNCAKVAKVRRDRARYEKNKTA